MKVLGVVLGLFTATVMSGKRPLLCQVRGASTVDGNRSDCGVPHIQSTGEVAVTVVIRAYNATGELDIKRDPFTLGTRFLLTCDVTGLTEENEALRYRWHHKCTRTPHRGCEIRDGDPYYRVVRNSLLVAVTSNDQGGRYYCTVHGLQGTQRGITPKLSVTG